MSKLEAIVEDLKQLEVCELIQQGERAEKVIL